MIFFEVMWTKVKYSKSRFFVLSHLRNLLLSVYISNKKTELVCYIIAITYIE